MGSEGSESARSGGSRTRTPATVARDGRYAMATTGAGPGAPRAGSAGSCWSGLVRKDLKVKYQGSVLGFLWSLANPLLLLVVYTFVFQVVLKTGIPQFGFYLMSGLLIWNAFAGAVGTATGAVVGNAGLVKKVRFPLSVLPLSAVGFALVHFVLQLVVLLVVDDRVRVHRTSPGRSCCWSSRRSASRCCSPSRCPSWWPGSTCATGTPSTWSRSCCWPASGSTRSSTRCRWSEPRWAARPVLGLLPQPDGRRGHRDAARAVRAEPAAARAAGTVLADRGYAFYLGSSGIGSRSRRCCWSRRVGLPPAVGRLRRGAVGGRRRR